MAGYTPGDRDVLFVPVGIAYDRVLEDRVLTAAAKAGTRQFRARPWAILRATSGILWGRLRGRFKGFGTAAASFGPPLSLRTFLAANPGDTIETLGARLMQEITMVVPVLPVPLVAAALRQGPVTRADLPARIDQLIATLQATDAVLRLPPQGMAQILIEGLEPLLARGLVLDRPEGLVQAAPDIVGFYAASVQQRAGISDNSLPFVDRAQATF